METRHILAALSYFSIFFAGILLPFVIWILSDDPYVKRHSLQALFSQILPYTLIVVVVLTFLTSQFMLSLGLVALFAFICLAVFIWNIVMGVKIIMESRY